MKRYVKKLAVILTATMMLMMQVVTASAVSVTGRAVNWTLTQGVWGLTHYDTFVATGIYYYTSVGRTNNNTPMDSGKVQLTILRDSSTNLVEKYEYDEELIEYNESYTVSGDYYQLGQSICHVELYDNYFGTIKETLYNN